MYAILRTPSAKKGVESCAQKIHVQMLVKSTPVFAIALSCVATVVSNMFLLHAIAFSRLTKTQKCSNTIFIGFTSIDVYLQCNLYHSILLKYTNVDINASSKLKTLRFEFSIETFLSAENSTV